MILEFLYSPFFYAGAIVGLFVGVKSIRRALQLQCPYCGKKCEKEVVKHFRRFWHPQYDYRHYLSGWEKHSDWDAVFCSEDCAEEAKKMRCQKDWVIERQS